MNRIKELRKEKGMTLKDLSKEIGLRDSTLSQYETGKVTPRVSISEKLANFFGVSIPYLLGIELSFDEKKKIVTNIILETYDIENFGHYRNNDVIIEKLPDVDAISDLLENNALQSDNFDLSYEMEKYIKLFYPKEFNALKNKYNNFEHGLDIEIKEFNTDDEIKHKKNKHNDEIEKNLFKLEAIFTEYLKKIILLFINDLTSYLIKRKTPDLMKNGVHSNIAILDITSWFSNRVFEAKKDKSKSLVKSKLTDANEILNDITYNKMLDMKENIKYLYESTDDNKISISKDDIRNNIKILINEVRDELENLNKFIDKHH